MHSKHTKMQEVMQCTVAINTGRWKPTSPTKILFYSLCSSTQLHLQQNIIKNISSIGRKKTCHQSSVPELTLYHCISIHLQSKQMQFCCSNQITSTTCFSRLVSPQAGNLHSFSYNPQMLLSHKPSIYESIKQNCWLLIDRTNALSTCTFIC